jgi:deoxyribodipyrimidine photo-lyase
MSLMPGTTVHPPDMVEKPDDTPYTVFTPFSQKWKNLPAPGKPLAPPEHFTLLPTLTSMAIPQSPILQGIAGFKAGESEASHRLAAFIDADITHYAEARDRMDLAATSGLSPYLHFGMLSARQAASAALSAYEEAGDALGRKGVESWLNELIWREFYASILYHFPFVIDIAFRSNLRNVPWREDAPGFTAWKEGCTGYPVVDAGMRQLNTSGWMHNRARMLTASFLVKDLLIDWRKGEAYFMQHLLDGDSASNNGGWQWTAGTGTDAAPYFRVFNPVLQGQKFDPHGAYVRHWVPELAAVPDEFIHTPWHMPVSLQQKIGCVIGKNYPAPIVDHASARQRVLEAYRKGKNEQSL